MDFAPGSTMNTASRGKIGELQALYWLTAVAAVIITLDVRLIIDFPVGV
jgi:hypothetical protein